ncbi:MAG: outer membrane beta-barrel protein [Spirochaetaceae bacterium]|nr:outer membrane beta-barrel protein [Spirochaetaceae bacterium]
MKKIIAMAVVAAVAVSMVCAQITVGAKGTFGMNLGSQVADKDDYGDDVKNAFMVNGGGSIYGRYNLPFLPALGVQLEFGLTANNGAGVKVEMLGVEMTETYSYLSLDFPLLVTYDIPVGSIMITPMVGVNFSVPVGSPKLTTTVDGEKESEKMDGVKVTGFIPGIVAGVEVGIPAGPGSVTAGLSYVNDFTPVKAKYDGDDEKYDLLTRRNFNISLGYALKF